MNSPSGEVFAESVLSFAGAGLWGEHFLFWIERASLHKRTGNRGEQEVWCQELQPFSFSSSSVCFGMFPFKNKAEQANKQTEKNQSSLLVLDWLEAKAVQFLGLNPDSTIS